MRLQNIILVNGMQKRVKAIPNKLYNYLLLLPSLSLLLILSSVITIVIIITIETKAKAYNESSTCTITSRLSLFLLSKTLRIEIAWF